MSALGHKRTFAMQNGMSALPPKADMCSALGDVRFVPKADIGPAYTVTSPPGLRRTHSKARQNDPELGKFARLRVDLD